MSLVIAALLSLTLQQAKKPVTPPAKKPTTQAAKPAAQTAKPTTKTDTTANVAYLGNWVTVQAPGAKGRQELKLVKDGTFTMTVVIPDQPNHVAKGKFAVKAELPPGTVDVKDCTLYLTLESLDGSAIPAGKMQPKKLGYYSKGPVLTDTLAVVFCRPGDQDKITKMFADSAKAGKPGTEKAKP